MTWQAMARRQQGLVTRAQLRGAGLTGHGVRTACAQLVRVGHGLYCTRALPALPQHLLSGGTVSAAYVALVRAHLLRSGAGARASRRTAAVRWGFDLLVEPDRVELDVPVAGVAPRADADLRRSTREPTVFVVPVPGADPLAVTAPVDTVLDCALGRPLVEAVAVADSALRTGAVTVAQLRRAVAARRGQPFCGRLWRVLRLCDRRSGSVLESALRVLLCEAGLRPPERQFWVVRTDGTRVGRVDFAWPQQRVVVEADGRRWHDPHDARDRDRQRSNGCARAGYLVLRFTWADVLHRGDDVVDAVREALDRTTAPPGGAAAA